MWELSEVKHIEFTTPMALGEVSYLSKTLALKTQLNEESRAVTIGGSLLLVATLTK
jgi:hypothetical protein